MLPADVGGARTSPVQQTTTSWGGTRESPPTVRHFAGGLVQAANSDDSDEGDSLLPATPNVSNVAFNRGTSYAGSRPGMKTLVKRQYVLRIMEKFNESSQRGLALGKSPSDFVTEVVDQNDGMTAPKRSALIALLKKAVATADSRASVLRDASAEYRNLLADRGKSNVASGEFPEMEKALTKKFALRRKRGKKVGGLWLRMNARRF